MKRLLVRLAFPVAAAAGAAVTAAVVLAVVDIYLTGHNLPALSRPWVEWPAVGVHMSRADAIVLGAAAAAGIGAWFLNPRGRGEP